MPDTPAPAAPRVLIVADNASAMFGGEGILPLKYFTLLARRHRDVRLITHERNREALLPQIRDLLKARTTDDWIATLEQAGVPCGPINTLSRVFDDPHVKARGMAVEMPHPQSGSVKLVAAPAKMSQTPVTYRRPPPVRGEHTVEVLRDLLGLQDDEIARLRTDGIAEGE